MRVLGLACVIAVLCGCGQETFTCANDEQCTGGTCTVDGYCAFPDAACPSEQRYGQYAGSLSGTCVPLPEGSTGGDEASTQSTTAPPSSSAGSSSASTSMQPMDSSTTTGIAASTTSSGGDEVCPKGLTLCPDGCVDTAIDVTNCGGCDVTCEGECVEGGCITSKVVFVTSTTFDGDMGGLEGADAACQQAAETAGLVGTFMAWLSDDTGNPVTRMTGHDGPYVLVDGTMVAEDWDELRDGELLSPILLTELGTDPPDVFVCTGQEVWTNTTALGSLVSSGGDCGNWTLTMQIGAVGKWSSFDERWTDDALCPNVTCAGGLPIYCVEQ